MPFIQKGAAKLDRIMICWDGPRCRSCRCRCLAASEKGESRSRWQSSSTSRARATKCLAPTLASISHRHGFKVDVKHITSPDIDVPSTILSHASDPSADMIVMGGYGYSRLREFVLGGATRGLLESMTVPVLMSH